MPDLYPLLRPLLLRLDAERAHGLAIAALRAGLGGRVRTNGAPALRQTLWGRDFANPVGLAAGFDKNAEIPGAALNLGFGFVEAGTVTPRPQAGNPRPRVFRAADHGAVINRMGFPNRGLEDFRARMQAFRARPGPAGPVGVNIGMNKDQADPAADYCLLLRELGPYADYVAVNISSPNTPGLRDLQDPQAFLDLTGRILAERARCGLDATPLLVKFSPDMGLAQLEGLAGAVLRSGIDGMILTNTTLARPASLPAAFAAEKGGLSGQPLRDRATETLRALYRLTGGRLPLIGLGGIATAADAYARIRAGASLVQVYSALVFEGPALARRLRDGLAALLERDGFAAVADAVGADHRHGTVNAAPSGLDTATGKPA